MKQFMKEDIKELSTGWVSYIFTFAGFAILYSLSWKAGVGVGLLIIPFAYRQDVTRNIFRDYLLKLLK